MSNRESTAGTAVITGATSGIGRSYAEALAAAGHDLLLTGRRSEKLAAASEELEQRYGVAVRRRVLELTDRAALASLVRDVAALSAPAVLVNNAGFGRSSAFHEDDVEAQAGMVSVHVEATLRLTHAVIPHMTERGGGWIINVSSLASYLPLPRGAVYASTKAWIVSFTESIALELAPYGIRCQALLPGFTRTDFHRDPQYANLDRRNRGLIRWMDADHVVAASLRCIERNPRVLCIPGAANRLLSFVVRGIPRPVLHVLIRRTRVENNADTGDNGDREHDDDDGGRRPGTGNNTGGGSDGGRSGQ